MDLPLRDYLAGQALRSFMDWSLNQPIVGDDDSAVKAAKRYSKSAYLIADAMLEARKDEAK